MVPNAVKPVESPPVKPVGPLPVKSVKSVKPGLLVEPFLSGWRTIRGLWQ